MVLTYLGELGCFPRTSSKWFFGKKVKETYASGLRIAYVISVNPQENLQKIKYLPSSEVREAGRPCWECAPTEWKNSCHFTVCRGLSFVIMFFGAHTMNSTFKKLLFLHLKITHYLYIFLFVIYNCYCYHLLMHELVFNFSVKSIVYMSV